MSTSIKAVIKPAQAQAHPAEKVSHDGRIRRMATSLPQFQSPCRFTHMGKRVPACPRFCVPRQRAIIINNSHVPHSFSNYNGCLDQYRAQLLT